MKILFVGYFNASWSSHHAFFKDLKSSNVVVPFDFRYKIKKKFRKILFFNKLYDYFEIKLFPLIKKYIRMSKYYFLGNWKKNKQLLYEIRNNKYDLAILFKADTINYKIIPKLNKFTKTFFIFNDHLNNAINLNSHKVAALSSWSSASVSNVVKLFKREGANCYHMIEGFNSDLFYPDNENIRKEIDIIFVGNRNLKRERIVQYLRNNKINVECYGPGWEHESIFLEKLVARYKKSKIILNITRTKIGFSDRVVHALGLGSFVITDYCRDIEKFFQKGVHLEWFKDLEDLLKVIKFYLKNDERRQEIAEQGSKYVHENYTWQKYFKRFLEFGDIQNIN